MPQRTPAPRRLDLVAIAATLQELQRELPRIGTSLNAARDRFSDEIRDNLLAGYRFVDQTLAGDIARGAPDSIFEGGSSNRLLEVNHIVLYGADRDRWQRYQSSVDANEARFYQKPEGGIGGLVEGYRMTSHQNIWNRCALLYIHMLSQPQLFIEGNHRTAALLVSYLLAREGQPPFVLSADIAEAVFNRSAAIGRARWHSLRMLFRRPRLKRYFARLLAQQANPDHLLTGPEPRPEDDHVEKKAETDRGT